MGIVGTRMYVRSDPQNMGEGFILIRMYVRLDLRNTGQGFILIRALKMSNNPITVYMDI